MLNDILLEDKEDIFYTLQNIIGIFKNNIEYDDMLKLLLEKFLIITKGNSGFIVKKVKQSDVFKITFIKEIKTDRAKDIINFLNGYFKKTFKSGNIERVSEENFNNSTGILIPIKAEDKVLAVIFLEFFNKKDYKKIDYKLIKTISELASYNISKILVYNSLKEKIKLKELLIKISNSIEKVFSLKDVFDVVVKKLAENFDIIRGMLVLFDLKNI